LNFRNTTFLPGSFDVVSDILDTFFALFIFSFTCITEVCRIRSTGVDSAGVGIFQQQDQEWKFSIGTGAGVIFNHSVHEIILSVCILRDLWQESINFL